jgi:hypothetical protein
MTTCDTLKAMLLKVKAILALAGHEDKESAIF